jgi:cobalt/nickel transport system permease protein
MPGPIEELPCISSPLGRSDARWKLAGLLLAVVAVVFLRSLAASALALSGAVVLAFLARLPKRWCLVRVGMVLLVLAPFLVLLPFVQAADPEPLAEWGPLLFSTQGALAAVRLALKTLSIVLIMLVLLATAPLPETFKAAQALRVPGLLVQLAGLTYRYLFVLAGEFARLRVALRVRGYRNRPSLHSYRTIGHVAGTLLVRGWEQAERVEQAMRCRGFDGRFRTLTEFQTRPADVLGFFVIVGYAGALLGYDVVRSL